MAIESWLGNDNPDLDERALDAVASLVHSIDGCEGDMVQRFVLIVETVDENDRWTSAFTAPGQKAWDTLGLLEYGSMLERSAHIVSREGEDD